ncbi:hypothetical protein, partial [Porphyromonas gingivalis]|uniref:hypothetical protein n=1 Tax=Porphyromonas gingivalis TaxID=837 RepID=UPI0015CF56F8
GHEGKYLLNITNTTQQDYLSVLNDRTIRQRVLEASIHRTDKGIVILLDQLLSLGFDGGLVTFVNGFYALEKFVVKIDGIA